jgi:uncharacterized membrane protein
MSFTTFIDDLALVQVLLLIAATIFAYGGVMAYLAIRRNDPAGLRSVLRGMAVPLGVVGAITLALSLWGEMTWPFLASDGLAGYNIFFFDVLMLFAIVVLAFVATVYLSARLQYVGLLALVAGGVTAFYGWTGYTASPAFTKDPFDTLLLYAGFAAAGIFALPATIVVDYYLEASAEHRAPFTSIRRLSAVRSELRGTRAVQPVLGHVPATAPEPYDEIDTAPSYHLPYWVQTVVLLFPVFMALAGIAAFWYFGVTLPGHLGAGAGAAP